MKIYLLKFYTKKYFRAAEELTSLYKIEESESTDNGMFKLLINVQEMLFSYYKSQLKKALLLNQIYNIDVQNIFDN